MHARRSELFKTVEQLLDEDNWEQDSDARSALFLTARLVTTLEAWSKAPARSTLFTTASHAVWEDDFDDRSEALCAARLVVQVPPRPRSPAQRATPPRALCSFRVTPISRERASACARVPLLRPLTSAPAQNHPGVELRANLKSISHRCHLFEVAFVWELTKETIHLPLGCLQGGACARVPLMRTCTEPGADDGRAAG